MKKVNIKCNNTIAWETKIFSLQFRGRWVSWKSHYYGAEPTGIYEPTIRSYIIAFMHIGRVIQIQVLGIQLGIKY